MLFYRLLNREQLKRAEQLLLGEWQGALLGFRDRPLLGLDGGHVGVHRVHELIELGQRLSCVVFLQGPLQVPSQQLFCTQPKT